MRDERSSALHAHAHAAGLGVGDRVVEQVVERDRDVGDVGRHEDVLPAYRREVRLEHEAPAARGGAVAGDRVVDRRAHVGDRVRARAPLRDARGRAGRRRGA